MTEPEPEPARRTPRWLKRTFIAVQIAAGLVLGLLLTEKLFEYRAEGAFPHVNFYLADPELGVRLEPGASMNFKLGSNPRSTIQVNAQGYRGADWPDPIPGKSEGEIVVLGDSQVFGLGVEDDETFSAKLAAATGRTVLNAGVPTYGPPEYLLLARELLAQRKPAILVVTLNYLNDPFELDRPNKDRHVVWDGWAVRAEHAPESSSEFPGRKWLYSRSHAFYALRRWQHEREGSGVGEDDLDLGTPSEGGYQDLLTGRQRAQSTIDQQADESEQSLAASRERMTKVEAELTSKRDELDELLTASNDEFTRLDRQFARGQPGDIVGRSNAERSRSTQLTAALIREAARERKHATNALLRKQSHKGETTAQELVDAEAKLVSERRQLRGRLAIGTDPLAPVVSVFEPFLRELDELCKHQGTELIVIALPVDVQVDPAEWDKYGVPERPDMSESLILIDDLIADAEALHIRALDATAALRAAEPGAFLDEDIHMSAKGHSALAEALADLLATPASWSAALPRAGLPEGLTFVPVAADWDPITEVRVDGNRSDCGAWIEADWFKFRCARRSKRDRFTGIELLAGATPATMALQSDDGLSLVTPLTQGVDLDARFHWQSAIHELQVRWRLDRKGKLHFDASLIYVIDTEPLRRVPNAAVESLCACHRELTHELWCEVNSQDGYSLHTDRCQPSCAELWADPKLIDPCTSAFPGDCAALLACVQNDPLFAPACPAGSVHAFASNGCFAACDDAHPCSTGVCTPWQGAFVCVPAGSP